MADAIRNTDSGNRLNGLSIEIPPIAAYYKFCPMLGFQHRKHCLSECLKIMWLLKNRDLFA
jgi:hypothetical protein